MNMALDNLYAPSKDKTQSTVDSYLSRQQDKGFQRQPVPLQEDQYVLDDFGRNKILLLHDF